MTLRSRILIADNDAANVQLLTDICQAEALEVLVAMDGDETLVKIHEENPDLVLLDVMMPHRDGFEVLQELRSKPLTRTLPVILVTAVSDDDSIRQGYRLGANDYITKPFKVAELVSRMTTLIKAAAYQRLTQNSSPRWAVGNHETLMAALTDDPPAPFSLLLFRLLQLDRIEQARDRTTALRAAQSMSERLRLQVRGVDTAHFLPPDRLVLLLESTGRGQAEEVAQRLARAFNAPIRVEGDEFELGCRWAVITSDEDAHDGEQMLQQGLETLC